jgi:peptidoglycan/xylan/chitin deacetylase (PgdA/CDA1 family)
VPPDDVKHAALAALTREVMLPLAYPFTRGAATILMLHRFASEALGNPGHAAETLRRHLAFLRRHRFELVPLADLVARLERGDPPLHKAVTFTVDDGYGDFASVGAGIFAEFDCPVTVFVVTGFLDRRLWLWWDQVEFMLTGTRRAEVDVDMGDASLRYRIPDTRTREGVCADLVERLKRVDDATRRAALARLALDLDVEVPATPPPRYAPMTWDEARRCAHGGATFGPHTVTHPILSRVGDRQADAEISESWRRVRTEIPHAPAIFCYPNGDLDSFTAREPWLLRTHGLAAALTTVDDYASPRLFRSNGGSGRYAIPRFPYLEQDAAFRQIVSGLERAKRRARGLLRQ